MLPLISHFNILADKQDIMKFIRTRNRWLAPLPGAFTSSLTAFRAAMLADMEEFRHWVQ
jgi:hypothetical protein